MAEGAVAKDVDARHTHELALQLAHHREVRTLALAPGLQDQAHEGAMRGRKAIDGEQVLPLRHIHEDAGELSV